MYPPTTHVLVVDDMNSLRSLAVMLLKDLGFTNIHQAADGLEALDALESLANAGTPAEVVLMDVSMPNMDGIAALKFIRSEEKTKKIPVIMLTAENDKETIMTALKEGANSYVLKPLTLELLKAKLTELFAKQNRK